LRHADRCHPASRCHPAIDVNHK
ncbi:hypothetical protein AZZ95_001080, partial [Enterobacter roggenkampii]